MNIQFQDLPFVILNDRQQCDYELIQCGALFPLNGFMTYQQYYSCVYHMSLPDETIWPIPIVLHVSKKWLETHIIDDDIINNDTLPKLKNTQVLLKHETGLPLAIMNIESIFEVDFLSEIDKVYDGITDGKIDINHPYVNVLEAHKKNGEIYCIGGKFISIMPVPRYDYQEFRKTPQQIKELIEKNGWSDCNIVAFQTRNPMHKSHFHLTKQALRDATNSNGKKSILLLHPTVGVTQSCDINYTTRVKCYIEILKHYEENVIFSLLPMSMRMAGPREAVLHAIIRKNYGATHFIVGRDHAGPSYTRSNNKSFYHPLAAQILLSSVSDKIGINMLSSQAIVYTVKRDKIYQLYYQKYIHSNKLFTQSLKLINDDDIKQNIFSLNLDGSEGVFKAVNKVSDEEMFFEISGTQQRRFLAGGEEIPKWFSYPEIISILRSDLQQKKGIVLYFIGLSGSGKSTLANELASLLERKYSKKITILDGDIVRLFLSKGLGFSREDRSTNVRRIGYVASEIAYHSGICIVANIAPYSDDREFNKKLITSKNGIYLEIFVDTCLEECMRRDVKGLYQKALENKIKISGLNDIFELPNNPDIRLDGTKPISHNINTIMQYISHLL